MSYIYGKKFTAPSTSLILNLREELFTESYNVNMWKKARYKCAKVINYICIFKFE